MKHVFKQLQVYQPTTRVGESYKPCQFKTSTAIIDLEYISAVVECVTFKNESKLNDEISDWLENRQLTIVKIILKDGSKIPNIIVPNMEYFGVILNDVTF